MDMTATARHLAAVQPLPAPPPMTEAKAEALELELELIIMCPGDRTLEQVMRPLHIVRD